METRYDYGGDEYIFVEFDIEMSLEVNFKILSVCQEIEHQKIILAQFALVGAGAGDQDVPPVHAGGEIVRGKNGKPESARLNNESTHAAHFGAVRHNRVGFKRDLCASRSCQHQPQSKQINEFHVWA